MHVMHFFVYANHFPVPVFVLFCFVLVGAFFSGYFQKIYNKTFNFFCKNISFSLDIFTFNPDF